MKRQVSINSNGYNVRSSVFCLLGFLVVLLVQTVTVKNVGAESFYDRDIKYLHHTSVVDLNLYMETSELSGAFDEIPGSCINSVIDSYHLELWESFDPASSLFLVPSQNAWIDQRPDLSVVLSKQNDKPTPRKQRTILRNQYRMWSGRKIQGNSGLHRESGLDRMQNEYEGTGITRAYVVLAALDVNI